MVIWLHLLKVIFYCIIQIQVLFDIKQTAPANFLFSAFVKCGNRYYLGTRRHGIIVYNENWKLLEHIYPTSIQGGILEDGLISY